MKTKSLYFYPEKLVAYRHDGLYSSQSETDPKKLPSQIQASIAGALAFIPQGLLLAGETVAYPIHLSHQTNGVVVTPPIYEDEVEVTPATYRDLITFYISVHNADGASRTLTPFPTTEKEGLPVELRDGLLSIWNLIEGLGKEEIKSLA